MIDVLVGVAIGLLAVVVAYQAFVALDALRRRAAGAADAQGSAAFALYALTSQIGNAGAGVTAAAQWLDTCPADPDVTTTQRPIAVVITDGGGSGRPDSLVVRQALAATPGVPAAFAAPAARDAVFRVESPDAFAVGDRVVAVSRTGICETARITAVGAPAAGIVEVAHPPVANDLPRTSVLLNLGPAARASTTRFDVAAGTLRSTDIANADAPVPLTSNVVNLKFQYGLDSDADGALDTWVGAADADWTPARVLAAPRATLERIKAVRIGLVRSDARERTLMSDFHWVLFDCEREDKATCPGRLEGTIAASAAGGYRYRVYETVVALPNVIWNRGA
jgi:type IV pilus assembly protein PilW